MADQDFPQAPPNSTTAIISLIAGIAGLTILPTVGSIVALITGFMARKEIQESNGTLGGDNLAVIGLILGFLGIGLGLVICCIIAFSFVIPIIAIGASELFLVIPF